MKIRARWDAWSAWSHWPAHSSRTRELRVDGASVGRMYHLRTSVRTREFPRPGNWYGLRLGSELTTPYFRTQKAALRRLK